jgi:hypothetical protein
MSNFLKALKVKGIEIDTAGAITGDVLKYDGTKFGAASAGGSSVGTLDNLSDVIITTPYKYQSLIYDGTNWVNDDASTITYVSNAETTTLNVGEVVYLYQQQGDRASVKRAINTSDATSAKTLGVVAASIAANASGPVVTQGYVTGCTLGSFTAGQTVYLGATAGTITSTKPYAPNHLVYIGVVVRANNGNGILYVRAQNGYELDEIHDVDLTTTPPTAGQYLRFGGTVWTADTIDLGTDTTGNYMSGISGTSPVSVAHTPAEGSSATVSLAASYGDTQNPYASKTANYVLAAPNGSAGVPTFRAIVAADIPTLNQNTTGTASNITASSNTTLTSLANLTTVGTLSALRVDGNFGIGGAGFAQIGLRFVKDIGGSAFSQGIFIGGAIQSTVTNRADMIWTAPTVAASATVPTVNHFYATLAGVGTGSTVTTSAGFVAESNLGNNDLGTITNAYGFIGNLNTLAGFSRFNLLMNGSAPNYLSGRLGVGAALTSGAMAIVANTTAADKAFIVRGAASQSGDFFDVQNSGGTSQFKVDSVGNIGISNTPAAGRSFVLAKTMTGSIAPIGFFSAGQIQSDATNSANYFNTFVNTAVAAFTCGTAVHYKAQQGTIGAGSSIGTQVGFLAESSLIGATGNNLGFWGAIPADAAKNFNLYMSGTAPNYLAGRLGVGAALTSGIMAQVVNTTAGDKAFVIKGAAAQSGDFLDVQDSSGASEFKIDSSGRVGVNASTSAGTQLIIGGTTDSSALGSGIASGQTLSSTMLDYKGFWSLPALPAGSNTYTQLLHFHANPSAIGAGTTLSTSAGFVASSSLGSNFSGTVTTAYGFWGNLASGTNRYNLYMGGTAQNYMAGNLGIGTTTPDTALDVVGTTTLKTVKAGSGVVAISSASYSSGFGTTNYSTTTPHGFATGDTIAVTGITPSSFNRTATITVATSTQFYFSLFDGSTGGAYSSGGTATGPPSTLYVDSTNDRIGIGTSSPTEKLDVVGNIALTGSVVFEGATANGFETTLAVTDPTGSDKTITLPDASGTVALVGTQTVRSITASTDTPTGADLGDLLTIDTTSGAVTVTINSSLGLTAGQRIDFMWIGAATSVTFSASSVTMNGTPGLKLRARYSAATLVCTASNTYVLVGDLSA